MAEYIVRESGYPGTIKQEIVGELVRCKDCKYLSYTTLGMPLACWHGAHSIWGETGEHADHTVCVRIDDENHFCSHGERRNDDRNG